MADAPKEDSILSKNFETAAGIGGILIFLVMVGILWRNLNYMLAERGWPSLYEIWYSLLDWLHSIWPMVKFISLILSVLLIYGIYKVYKKRQVIVLEEKAIYRPEKLTDIPLTQESVKNHKWEKVLEHINSAHASDWKLAIIEADVMLDELLRHSGYHGETIGEMLKSVEKSDMLSLESAWSAHKVRNKIAHEGSGFLLTERDAKQTIADYESVFKEFAII